VCSVLAAERESAGDRRSWLETPISNVSKGQVQV
jgi:hypothetical protein